MIRFTARCTAHSDMLKPANDIIATVARHGDHYSATLSGFMCPTAGLHSGSVCRESWVFEPYVQIGVPEVSVY